MLMCLLPDNRPSPASFLVCFLRLPPCLCQRLHLPFPSAPTMSAATRDQRPSVGIQLQSGSSKKDQPVVEGFDFSATENVDETGTVEDIRQTRKETLACAFRIFARNQLGVGVVGHLTVRDPEWPDRFWVNPFAKAFSSMTASDLILIDHQGDVVFASQGRTRVYNRAAFVRRSSSNFD